ncbi:MAG: DUF2087 domain-containing protein [Anaerolineales bacterium]|nr:DUF2087 domain-containing protein [Anaerolineales bacterium]
MDSNSPTMLDFIKAMSDPDRLRIIGVLSQGPLTAARVAEAAGFSYRAAVNHLAFLEYVGAVRVRPAEKKQDDVYELDAEALEGIARRELEGRRPVFTPAPDLEQERRRTLAAYLNPDGSIRQIPNAKSQMAKFRIVLDHVAGAFTFDTTYTEREVNVILKRFHADISGLRRDLVDAGLLARERDGSKYWRPAEEKPV